MSRLSVANKGSLVSINGVKIPRGCYTLNITYQDLSDSDSGRSMTGKMFKGYLCTVRTLNCVWNSLVPSHIKTLLQAVKGKNSFPVEFYDPESGSYVTSDFYVGDRSCDYRSFFKNGELIGLSMNLIEVNGYK